MNILLEYQGLANRTAKVFPTKIENLVHAALGVGSEAGELSLTVASAWMQVPYLVENIPEEIGDGCWYAAYLCETMGWKFDSLILGPELASDMSNELSAAVIGRNPPAIVLVLNAFAGEILTVVKATHIYGKELDETRLLRNLQLYVTTLNLIASAHELDFFQILAANIYKLQQRYPDKYSDEDAIKRADKLEEASLS